MITSQQKRRVRQSYQTVQEIAEPVAMLFYGRLFDLDPSLRPLFKVDMHEQSRKLMAMLTNVVDSLDDFDKLRPLLAELGRKHVSYGVLPAHYLTLRSALLWSFGQALQSAFDRETQ